MPKPAELAARGLADLAAGVIKKHTVTYNELFSLSKKAHIKIARFAFWAGLREKGWGYGPIAEMWDTDASSVMRALRKSE